MSAGVAKRPLDECDLSISDCTRSSSDGLRRPLLAHTVAAELQAMGIVNDAIQDGVGQGGIPDQGMPTRRYRIWTETGPRMVLSPARWERQSTCAARPPTRSRRSI